MTAITHINDSSNVDRTQTKGYIMDATLTDRLVQKIIVMDSAGVDREVFVYFSATADSDYLYGSSSGGAASGGPVNTATCTITLVGGSGSATYSWVLVSFNRGVWSASSPSTNATTFGVSSVQSNLAYNSVWRCDIVDGSNTTSVTVDAAVDWFDTR